MPTPVCIQNDILVELDNKFIEEIVTDGGLKLFKDATYRPEWSTTITGKVVSVPKKLTIGNGGTQSLDFDRVNIKEIVKVGDEIIFNYLVVMNRKYTNNAGDVFERETPTSPFITTWSNGNGLQIIREYKLNNKYQCILIDKSSGVCIDMVSGNQSDMDAFLGRHMPTSNGEFNYSNLLQCDNKDYWRVDYSNAMAIKRGDGDYEMVGSYVLLEPIREPFRGEYSGVLDVYEIAQDTDYRAIAKVVSVGEQFGSKKLTIKKDDIIVTDIRYVEKYTIDGNDLWVVRQRYIYGKSVINEPARNI